MYDAKAVKIFLGKTRNTVEYKQNSFHFLRYTHTRAFVYLKLYFIIEGTCMASYGYSNAQ